MMISTMLMPVYIKGGYVETLEGESWAYTFQDRDYMGRCVMLYPMKWKRIGRW